MCKGKEIFLDICVVAFPNHFLSKRNAYLE